MTSHIRAGLFASVLLLSTSLSVPGFADEAELLPNMSASDIAQDVKREYNNRTGIAEYIAPTFDPFEHDPTMAGSVNLRSVSGSAVSIDGETLSNGAILEVAFYYSSPNDDPYDGRGFNDIAFLSGSVAPAIRRDNRILECSRDVQDIVYNDRFYYAPFLSVGLYRPYRHYGGHRRFGRFDRPFWRNRGYGRYNRSYGRGVNRGWSRGGYDRYDNDRRGERRGDRRNDRGDRAYDRDRRRNDGTRDRDRNRNDRVRNGDRNRDRAGDRRRDNRQAAPYVRSDRRGTMRGTVSNRTPRAVNSDRNRNRSDEARRAERRANRAANRNNNQVRNDRVRRDDRVRRNDRVRNNDQARRVGQTRTRENRVEISRRNETGNQNRAQNRAERRATNRNQNREARRAAPRQQREVRRESRPRPDVRATPRRESRPTPQRRANPPKRVRNERPRSTIKTSRQARDSFKEGTLNFFPRRNNYGRSVVRTVNVDCAREETLNVFIPEGRLNAARYDGLTVLALDNRGEEHPIFIPPNYIEGFQSAVSGKYNASTGRIIAGPSPVYRGQSGTGTYGTGLSGRIEAQCPSGTYKQPDGTCMIENGAYPQ